MHFLQDNLRIINCFFLIYCKQFIEDADGNQHYFILHVQNTQTLDREFDVTGCDNLRFQLFSREFLIFEQLLRTNQIM